MKWLDRGLVEGPYLALVTTEEDFHKAMRHLKVPRKEWSTWLEEDSQGCVHTLKNPSGGLACVVCIRPKAEADPIEMAGVLIHESVHVWQMWCKYKEEREPSIEFEAYAIESISKRLLKAYAASL
jgi:hypothetical protein